MSKKQLSENNLRAGAKVIWRNKIYKTGNRRHGLVELFMNDKFIRICSMKSIRLVKNLK